MEGVYYTHFVTSPLPSPSSSPEHPAQFLTQYLQIWLAFFLVSLLLQPSYWNSIVPPSVNTNFQSLVFFSPQWAFGLISPWIAKFFTSPSARTLLGKNVLISLIILISLHVFIVVLSHSLVCSIPHICFLYENNNSLNPLLSYFELLCFPPQWNIFIISFYILTL